MRIFSLLASRNALPRSHDHRALVELRPDAQTSGPKRGNLGVEQCVAVAEEVKRLLNTKFIQECQYPE